MHDGGEDSAAVRITCKHTRHIVALAEGWRKKGFLRHSLLSCAVYTYICVYNAVYYM